MKKLKQLLATLLVLALLVSPLPQQASSVAQAKTLKTATFAYLDVGQGNAELIKVGGNATLIDTGRGWEYNELQTQLKKCNVSKINTLIVSHPDADHMENADKIIKEYKVKRIIMPKIKATTQCFKRMISAIKKYKVKKVNPKIGATLKLGANCKGKVLSVDASSSDTNEASIVLRVTYGSRSFLYMGDATARVESNIISAGYKIASDVYLCSHHGSDTANGILFVKKALSSKYKIAVISVGKNSYGHPVKNVVRRLQKYSKKLYRTDKNGMIKFTSNGVNLIKK